MLSAGGAGERNFMEQIKCPEVGPAGFCTAANLQEGQNQEKPFVQLHPPPSERRDPQCQSGGHTGPTCSALSGAAG